MSQKKSSRTSANTYPADTNDAEARRRTVRKVLAGAVAIGVVQHWSKPIVESVVLPTHGQTSAPAPQPPAPQPPAPNGPPPPPQPPAPAVD
ncbi:MAG TPA: hypothetical protein VK973_10385 [Arenicellales bacterium]|nr:hypothetical protein [Arenicellales bacterium]